MEYSMRYRDKLIILLIFGLSLVSLRCPLIYNCEGQDYYCYRLFSTLPYERPIKYDDYTNSILYANGTIVYRDIMTKDITVVSLEDICNCDTICDIEFYDDEIRYRIFSPPYDTPRITSDSFKVVLSPDRCLVLDWDDNIIREFGDFGPDSTLLINALDVAISYERQIYIIDGGDNSIKIYDSYGNYISKWSCIGIPNRLKILDNYFFVLDKLEDSVRQLDIDGNYIKTITEGLQFYNIVAFIPPYENEFWIADLGGKRLTLISEGTRLVEFDGNFCYMDAIFDFGLIYSFGGGASVVDIEKNLLIDFAEYDPNCCY